MPYDWLFEVERIIIGLVPAYTLEMLDNCDIERLLPYYFFDYRKALALKTTANSNDVLAKDTAGEEFVVRNGKRYRVINADKAAWINDVI